LTDAPTESGAPVPEAPEAKAKSGINWWRMALLALIMGALWVFGEMSGLTDDFDVERIRTMVREAGAIGVVLYFVIFAGGELVHIPGIVFVLAGLVSWGQVVGYPIALAASVVSVSVSFLVVRLVGGRALAGLNRPMLRRILDKLDQRPIRTVFILRTLLFLAPPLNYALGMTDVRFRDYVIGSALGLAGPLLVVTLLFEWVMSLIS
jgi:uncharacterized membrane protein YdjX (TVP38/TMEM64 family)